MADGLNRRFDLMFSYPPESLADRQNETLEQIFEDSNQVKVLVK